MNLRIATFNVENLFRRARIFSGAAGGLSADPQVLKDVAKLNELIDQPTYSAADKTAILAILDAHNILSSSGQRPFILNEINGRLVSKKRDGTRVVADGRGAWNGWIDFPRVEISSRARENTARVLQAVDADIVCLVEVEDRVALEHFLDDVLHKKFAPAGGNYGFNMLIDGNDPRGIDVAILSRFPLGALHTHLFDAVGNSRTFSRDCPEYEVQLPGNKSLFLLPNHLKSKGYGAPAQSNARRKRQAQAIADILAAGYDLARDLVVVAGDLNDTPGSDPLSPLLGVPNLSDSLDQSGLAANQRWTYVRPRNQIDYLLTSAPLTTAQTGTGIERRGMFANVPGRFPEVTQDSEAASDHAAVWADFTL